MTGSSTPQSTLLRLRFHFRYRIGEYNASRSQSRWASWATRFFWAGSDLHTSNAVDKKQCWFVFSSRCLYFLKPSHTISRTKEIMMCLVKAWALEESIHARHWCSTTVYCPCPSLPRTFKTQLQPFFLATCCYSLLRRSHLRMMARIWTEYNLASVFFSNVGC